MDEAKKAAGGRARAAALSPETRKEIAAKAATARWDRTPRVLKKGVIAVGDARIPCAVLDTKQRVLTDNGISLALLGQRSGASKRKVSLGAPLPVFVAPSNLKPFISDELASGLLVPILYKDGEREIIGYDAAVLPAVCDVWLKARDAEALQTQQLAKAKKAEILMRALAHVAIIALVDEATGFQDERPGDALQALLEHYIRKELAAWVKRFPDEFYENIYKLRNWKWSGMSKNRFSVVAQYTRDLVYERLAPKILDELEKKAPKNDRGQRPSKLHQWLTDDVGHPALAQHLHSIIMLQRLALANGYTWPRFVRSVDQVMPRKGNTLLLALPEAC